jgi:signal transduction histidine kinase
VRNLLDNALRYAVARVDIAVAEVDDDAVLSIMDDGPGVPAELRDRVFERFARADDARAADTGGTGLGLAIARELVDLHGGSLTLDGAGVAGTRFVVRLPVAHTAAPL